MTTKCVLGPIVHINDCSDVASLLVSGLLETSTSAQLLEPRVRPRPGAASRLPSWRYSAILLLEERLRLGLSFKRGHRKADLLHIHYGMFGFIGLVAGVPFILHFHGSDLIRDHQRWHYRLLHRVAARRAAACLVSTPDLLQFADAVGVDLRFMPNPAPSAPAVARLSRGQTTPVLFASKIDSGKDPATFLAAGLALALSGVQPTVLGFGDAAQTFRRELEAIQRAGGRVLWERLPSASFAEEVARADIVVGQFGVGAFGMTELLAFQLAKPVVTHFGYRDAYGTAPAYWEAADDGAIVSAVLCLLADASRRRELGAAAHAWVAREHGLDVVVSRIRGLYEEVLADARCARQSER